MLSKNARRCMANAIAGRLSVLLAKLHACLPALALAALCVVAAGCHERDDSKTRSQAPTAALAPPSSIASLASTPAAVAVLPEAKAAAVLVPSCRPGQQLIPGGKVWIGSDPKEHLSDDEIPRFLTYLAP